MLRKITLLTSFLLIISSIAFSSMSKMYIGNEDGQMIIGIESLSINNDGGGGLEIRTYFKKNGIIVNGTEYGAAPSKTKYTLTLAGKDEDGTFLKYRKNWIYSKDLYDHTLTLAKSTQLEAGVGEGNLILYH